MYEPEDLGSMLYYREEKSGQILEEGISEAAAISSWIAAATSYSVHDLPMLPFYIYYSMFGYQRIGDLIWAAADQRTRGFLIGATSGRTTLGGEGLQHQDGSSHIMAAAVPNCRAYDPAYAYEVAVIVEHGMRRMLDEQRDEFFYLTVTNENLAQPDMPADEGISTGILRGMYRLRAARKQAEVRLLGAGPMLREAEMAAERLHEQYGVDAEVWSVTSFSELARDGREAERARVLGLDTASDADWVRTCLGDSNAPVIAATDYVRAVPEQIRAWVPAPYRTLGTDGFGRSDTRAQLRDFFEVSADWITLYALDSLGRQTDADKLRNKLNTRTRKTPPWNS
jgi:pyruvate dehydrogenase E1 component